MKPFVSIHELPMTHERHGSDYEAHMAQIGAALGARHLGCRSMRVPPGKKAWPFHNHHANDEMFVILEGEATLRFGADQYTVKAGDVVMCPAGGPETAHQLINTGAADLVYLAVSTMREPDVTEYPDSGAFGVMAGAPPGGDKTKRRFQFHGRGTPEDYWEK